MTRFDELKSKDIDQLAEWLDKYGQFDRSPWLKWWDEHYCQNCESIKVYVPDFDRECQCAWCELEHKCKFFQDKDDVPNNKEIITMWLESDEC